MRLVRLSLMACVLVTLSFAAVLVVGPPASLAAVPPGAIGVGHGTAEGIDVDLSHYSSGDVDSTSSSKNESKAGSTTTEPT